LIGSIDLGDFNNDCLHKLTMNFHYNKAITIGGYRLPESLQELRINLEVAGLYNEHCEVIDQLLYNLPKGLKYLKLPLMYQIRDHIGPFVLPQTLDDLEFNSAIGNYNRLIVAPNKEYKGCTAKVRVMKDFKLLYDKPYISTLDMLHFDPDLLKDLVFPNHIKRIYTGIKLNEFINLPSSLQGIKYYFEARISKDQFPSTLKQLCHKKFGQSLEAGLLPNQIESLELVLYNQPIKQGYLPSSLKELDLHDFNQKLDTGVLPPTLEKLSLTSYDRPLCSNVLPSALKILNFYHFNQELDVNVLPQSLTKLTMGMYIRPLHPNVLPKGLTFLAIPNFNQPLPEHSLPVSLKHLNMQSYIHTFDNIEPLNRLTYLQTSMLNQSMVTTILKVKKITIIFYRFENDVSLHHTSIERLDIRGDEFFSGHKIITHPEFFPRSLRYLSLHNIEFKSPCKINDDCIIIKSNIKVNK